MIAKIIEIFMENLNWSIWNLDVLWSQFETFDGTTKLVCTMIFSSYVILTSILGIAINLYGNLLLDRFKLEEKFPKIASFIKYRQKVSKYVILLNVIHIIIICLINIILGISILSLLIF